MVNEEWKQEFVKTGYAVVSANVQQGTYPPDKNYEAIRWLVRSDPARKAYKEARDTLKNARIIARRMRIALALSAISLGLLVVAIYMLGCSGTATELVNDPRLNLETLGGAIVISLPGTNYQVTFRRVAEGPGISASHNIIDDADAPITSFEFLERAWRVAKDKARELGWIG